MARSPLLERTACVCHRLHGHSGVVVDVGLAGGRRRSGRVDRDRVPLSNLRLSGADQRITAVDGDIADGALLERVLNEYEIEVVFHLAAQPLVRLANRAPLGTFDTNIRGTWLLLEACRRSHTVKRIVVASSDKAYGDQDVLPYFESAPLQGRHPYEVSKSCADLITQAYCTTYQLPVRSRAAATSTAAAISIGIALCRARCAACCAGKRRSFAATARRCATISTSTISSRDICGWRSAWKILRCTARRSTSAWTIPKSALDIAQTIIAMSDYPALKPVVLNQASHEIAKQYLSSEKSHRVLGWHAQYSVEEGLAQDSGVVSQIF